jgi:hypothetical protein
MSTTERRRCISPLQGFEIGGAPLTQAVGLGFVRSPLWGLRRTQMRALCLHVAENGHAANKDDENVDTPRRGQPARASSRTNWPCHIRLIY